MPFDSIKSVDKQKPRASVGAAGSYTTSGEKRQHCDEKNPLIQCCDTVVQLAQFAPLY